MGVPLGHRGPYTELVWAVDTQDHDVSGLYRSFSLSCFWVYQKVVVTASDAVGREADGGSARVVITTGASLHGWFFSFFLFFTWNEFIVWVCIS